MVRRNRMLRGGGAPEWSLRLGMAYPPWGRERERKTAGAVCRLRALKSFRKLQCVQSEGREVLSCFSSLLVIR